MSDQDWLAARFEHQRPRLRSVAHRLLGSVDEADDAIQTAWLRVSRAGTEGVDNLDGWLTTVVARVCLDMLRSRRSRREDPLELKAEAAAADDGGGPEDQAVMADSIGVALLVMLEVLTPAERVAFVLHDVFDFPFDEIAPIVGRSPAATRQLASRARRRVRGSDPAAGDDLIARRQVVRAFLDAARRGDFAGLLKLLDPEVVLSADAAAVRTGAEDGVRGAGAVAATFAGRARAARLTLVDGAPGLVWSQGGVPRVVFEFTIEHDAVVAIRLVAEPEAIGRLRLERVS